MLAHADEQQAQLFQGSVLPGSGKVHRDLLVELQQAMAAFKGQFNQQRFNFIFGFRCVATLKSP